MPPPQAAHQAFRRWSVTKPLERAAAMKAAAAVLRDHAEELAMIDAANCGNPVKEMTSDVINGTRAIDFYAGLVTEIKGDTVPMGEGRRQHHRARTARSVRADRRVQSPADVHPRPKFAAPLAAGNTVIMKPPPQAPLSAYRMMELIDGILPPGVLNVVTGGAACGEALTAHPLIPVVTLIGSVPTGRAIAKSAADRLKRTLFELGGKNALIVYPDADIERAVAARCAA